MIIRVLFYNKQIHKYKPYLCKIVGENRKDFLLEIPDKVKKSNNEIGWSGIEWRFHTVVELDANKWYWWIDKNSDCILKKNSYILRIE